MGYAEATSGNGGDVPKGNVVAELIVKFFHGEFTPQGFKRYSGLWKGPPPGNIGRKDIAVGMEGLKAQMANPMFVTKGGVGYGVDESQKVLNDNKGWVWLAAEMSPGGLAVELFQSVPFGKRAILVALPSSSSNPCPSESVRSWWPSRPTLTNFLTKSTGTSSSRTLIRLSAAPRSSSAEMPPQSRLLPQTDRFGTRCDTKFEP